MEITVNNCPVHIVYKAFTVVNSKLHSLSATGPLEKRYKLGKWTYADQWLLDLGLGLFAFEKIEDLEMARLDLGHTDSKGNLYSRGAVFCCMTTKILRTPPKKLLSMSRHNPTNFTNEMVIERLEDSMWDEVEKGAVLCENLLPLP